MVAVAPAHAQSIDPRRVASCELAAESLRERVRPETESYVRYDCDGHYWSPMVERFVPDQAQPEALLAEGRGQFNQALAQQDYLAGMTMVAGVLSQCNAGRAQLEAAAPHG